MYRLINPTSDRQLPMRMLFQPAGAGTFLRACEADSWRALVAAMLDDPDYETLNAEDRLVERHRLADDLKPLAAVDYRPLTGAHRDGPGSVNISPYQPML